MEGVVGRVRYSEGREEYVLTDGRLDIFLSTSEHIPHGACIEAEGDFAGESKITATRIEVLSGEKADAVFRRVKEGIMGRDQAA